MKILIISSLENWDKKKKVFTYRIAFNNKGNLTSFCCMTGTICSNFEQFSLCIALDVMKHTTNVHMWPYIGPGKLNDMGQTAVVCEALMMEERHDSCIFILKSMFLMAPKVRKYNVKKKWR